MANPKGRPKVENKWAWIVSESGVIPVEVRKHQGVYKTFMYDTEKQRTSFLREVKTPVFNSLEEANKNAPTFEGFNEDFLGVKEGGPRFYESKYGYELSPDMKLSIVEYRFNPASGARKEGYRRYKYNDAGQATLGRLAPGELFDSPQQGIDDWNTNYSNGKLIDWQAFDDAQADLAAREPSPEEVERYYGQDMPTYDDASIDGFDDFNDARPEKQIARQDMPDSPYQGLYPEDMAIDAMQMDEEDFIKGLGNDEDFIKQIEVENNIPKGSISKLGLALDPISEGLEFALKGAGLGSIANWWIKAEVANLVAGLIRGAGAASGVAQLGQSQALMGEEFTADADAIKNAFKTNLGNQMKLSPSLWLENKYAESDLGKGETPSQQAFGWVKNMFGASQ